MVTNNNKFLRLFAATPKSWGLVTHSMELSPSWEIASWSYIQEFVYFMERESSLPCSQEPCTAPYRESDGSSP
jgi:hypothetical protein